MPAAAKANPVSTAAGSAASAHHEWIKPIAAITTRNAAAYSTPRSSAQLISPRATSPDRIGVASAAS